MKEEKVPIGKLIKLKLNEDGRSMLWLAKKLNHNHSSLCKILKNDHINTELLLEICTILEHDFFAYFSTFLTAGKSITFTILNSVEK